MTLQWRPAQHNYYDPTKGRMLSPKELADLRNSYAAGVQDDLENETDDYARGHTSHVAWVAAFGAAVAAGIIGGYLLGAGGADHLDDADYERLATLIDAQQPYLDGFADDAVTFGVADAGATADAAGMSADELLARAGLYAGAGAHAFNAGIAATYDDLELPYMPGDDCQCGPRCLCSWDIEEDEDGWTCTWTLSNGADHCQDCLDRADEYGPGGPYTQAKGGDE